MSTFARASTVVPAPLQTVWHALRDFTFPAKLIKDVESVTIDENLPPTTVGAIRTMKWKNGATRKHRLLALDDQFYRVTWELVESDHDLEVSSQISTIKLTSITDTNETVVTWEADFAADVSGDYVINEQKFFAENLKDIKNALSQSKK
jgi:carbon monoxide dehydrogenase subunit G